MKSQSKRYQTQWAAQFYAAAELTRRGYQVAFTLGNAPRTDLLVSTPNDDLQFKIDVKGQSTRTFGWSRNERSRKISTMSWSIYPRTLASPHSFLCSVVAR